jgi:hypothetical protein
MEKEEKLMAESKSLWLALRDRYFEVETTDEEEHLLRRFAATALAQDDPDFADLCAVMSVVAVGKAASSKRQNEMKRRRMRWVWAAAACVAGLVLVMLAWPSKNVCVAYVADMVKAGETAPIEFCEENIKDIIISGRKHALLSTLERDLIEDASVKGNFEIY